LFCTSTALLLKHLIIPVLDCGTELAGVAVASAALASLGAQPQGDTSLDVFLRQNEAYSASRKCAAAVSFVQGCESALCEILLPVRSAFLREINSPSSH